MKPTVWTLPVDQHSTFIPLGCIHWPEGEKDLLKKWVKAVQEAENGWTILMGDSFDAARTHFRIAGRVINTDFNPEFTLCF